MKTNHLCSIVGCDQTASNKHHIGGTSSPMIWVCRACHGRIHGLHWNSEHSSLTRAGLAKAKSEGRVGGNPKLKDPEFQAKMKVKLGEAYWKRIMVNSDKWLPVVEELRPNTNWFDVTQTLNKMGLGPWTTEKLRRVIVKLVSAGKLDKRLTKYAPPRFSGAAPSHHLIKLICLKHESGMSLPQIAAWLEKEKERTPRGGSRWHPSSVRLLLLKGNRSPD